MVEGMDASLGVLLDKLDALGVAQDTLVIFTSDNGGLSAHGRGTTPRGTELNTHNWPLKAGKGSAYEGGTHVPFIAAWAKRDDANALQRALPIAPHVTSPQLVVSEDLFPTILGVSGADDLVPAGYPLDGRDIRGYLLQRTSDLERPLYFHYPHVWGPHGPGYEPHSAMRLGDWKVIYFYIPRRWELYNIKDDIGETKNLAAEQPERLAELAGKLKHDLAAMGAQWPTRRDTGEEEPMRTPAELEAVKPLLDFEAPDADQGVAVDAAFIYAIDNTVVAKHDKFTGALVKRWKSGPEHPLKHMNSGVVRGGRLYCAHSNYPDLPMKSSVEIWDTATMEHVESHDFGATDGSLTWMDWYDGYWWGCFAHYTGKGGEPGKDPSHTTLVRFDAEWRRLDAWKFPKEVIERVTPHSCSGGTWGPDGLLYVSGHDRAELYALRLPKSGTTLEYAGTASFPIEGQAIAFDRSGTGLLYGIVRSTSHIIAKRFDGLSPEITEAQ